MSHDSRRQPRFHGSLGGFFYFGLGMANKCFYCRCKMKDTPKGKDCGANGRIQSRTRTKDHLIPKNRGCKGRHGNIVWSCFACNNRKGTLTSFEYLGLKWMRYMFMDAVRWDRG